MNRGKKIVGLVGWLVLSFIPIPCGHVLQARRLV
jgi:hypothetical protein